MSSCQVIETTFFISKKSIYSDKLFLLIKQNKAHRNMRQASGKISNFERYRIIKKENCPKLFSSCSLYFFNRLSLLVSFIFSITYFVNSTFFSSLTFNSCIIFTIIPTNMFCRIKKNSFKP